MNNNNSEQKMDKKGLIILVLLLVAIVSTTFAVTFSRYISTGDASTEATVAKWQVKLGKKNGTLADITDGSIQLDDCNWDNTVSTAAEGTMAPGSVCNYDIEVENNSQVDALVDVSVSEVLDGEGNSLSNSSINVAVVDSVNHNDIQMPLEVSKEQKETVTLRITWDPNNSEAPNDAKNQADTDMGVDPSTITINLSILAKQKINNP
jgi:uncharacterized repeat protein (TIGR01451 family)